MYVTLAKWDTGGELDCARLSVPPILWRGYGCIYVNEARRRGRKKECKCMKLGRKGGRKRRSAGEVYQRLECQGEEKQEDELVHSLVSCGLLWEP